MTTYAQTAVARMEAITTEMGKLAAHDKMTRSQEQTYAALLEEFSALNQERLRAAVAGGHLERGSAGDTTPPRGGDVRSRALDVLERTERTDTHLERSVLDTIARRVDHDTSDAMARWVTIAGDPEYRTAFYKLVRNLSSASTSGPTPSGRRSPGCRSCSAPSTWAMPAAATWSRSRSTRPSSSRTAARATPPCGPRSP